MVELETQHIATPLTASVERAGNDPGGKLCLGSTGV